MKTPSSTKFTPEIHPAEIPRLLSHCPPVRRVLRTLLGALTLAAGASLAQAQTTIQVAGDLIVNLQSVDLVTTTNVWTNRTASPVAVANFRTTTTANNLNVAAVAYGSGTINALNVNATSGEGLRSISGINTPAEINADNPCSMEAWINANDLNQTSAVLAYGNTSSRQYRDFNYDSGGHGIASFYGPDQGWPSGVQSAGVWHYIASTFNPPNLITYQDGVSVKTNNLGTLATPASRVGVGQDAVSSGSGDAFHGYIAAARLESGVLTPSQIANNYAAGP